MKLEIEKLKKISEKCTCQANPSKVNIYVKNANLKLTNLFSFTKESDPLPVESLVGRKFLDEIDEKVC